MIFVVTVLATALGFGVVMIAKVALALLVALGPIFIACALFDATRRYFFGWLSQAVNYLTLFALIITVFELVLALVQQQWPSIDGQTNAEVAGMLFSALCILGAIFFLQTPAIAAGIAGGASAGLSDFGTAGAAMLRGKSALRARLAGAAAPSRAGGAIAPTGASPGGGSIRALPLPQPQSKVSPCASALPFQSSSPSAWPFRRWHPRRTPAACPSAAPGTSDPPTSTARCWRPG